MRITSWRKGARAEDVVGPTGENGVLWIHLDAGSTDSIDEAAASIRALGKPVPSELRCLFDEERYPGARDVDDDGCRVVVAFQAHSSGWNTEHESGDRGIELRVVEFLQAESLVVSRTEHSILIDGDAVTQGKRLEPHDWLTGVERRWVEDCASTSGDLATIALYTLLKPLTDVRRTIHGWLDTAEMRVVASYEKGSQVDASEVIHLRATIGHLARRIRALKVPASRESESWFSGRTDEGRVDRDDGRDGHGASRAKRADELLSRALDDLGRCSERLRSLVDLMLVTLTMRHEQAAIEQAKLTEALQRRIELLTAVLLVPTLVAGVYGANTALPGGGRWEGFAIMLAVMVVASTVALLLLYGPDRPIARGRRLVGAIPRATARRREASTGAVDVSSPG